MGGVWPSSGAIVTMQEGLSQVRGSQVLGLCRGPNFLCEKAIVSRFCGSRLTQNFMQVMATDYLPTFFLLLLGPLRGRSSWFWVSLVGVSLLLECRLGPAGCGRPSLIPPLCRHRLG